MFDVLSRWNLYSGFGLLRVACKVIVGRNQVNIL